MLFRELILAGARRVALSSWATYSVGIYVSLPLCLSLPLYLVFLLSLSPSMCFHVWVSPLCVCVSFHFFSLKIPLLEAVPLTASILSVPKQLSDSISMTHFLQDSIPTQAWVLHKQVTEDFLLSSKLFGASPVHRQDIWKKEEGLSRPLLSPEKVHDRVLRPECNRGGTEHSPQAP